MNNNESNNNNQQNNYVIPIEVNTNTNPISQQDTMLNRERANIVNATVMANENIDQKKSTEVNNRYNIIRIEEVFGLRRVKKCSFKI